MPDDREFYVGYFPDAPRGIARRTRLFVAVALAVALGGGALLVASQNTFSAGDFEFGHPKPFEGVLRSTPVPHLETAEETDSLLVAPFKHGARELVAGHDGAIVRLEGTLIRQDGDRMIELVPGSIESKGTGSEPSPAVPLGAVSLVGEIVDSKCWLGVMKPGEGQVHRACAILCIKGGVPPLFYARDREGRRLSAVLVSPEGTPVNDQVLDLVAIPVRVTGSLERRGDLLFLRADPATIVRVD